MKTQLTIAIALILSTPAFSQSAKIAASQKTSTSSSVRLTDQGASSGASTSASGAASASVTGIREKTVEAREQAVTNVTEAKAKTEAEVRENLDKKAELALASDAGVRSEVKTNTSAENVKISGATTIDAQPAINAGSSVVSNVRTVQGDANGAIKANAATGVHVASKAAVATKSQVKPVLNTTANFHANQSNRVKLKPVSVRSKTMTSGKVRL